MNAQTLHNHRPGIDAVQVKIALVMRGETLASWSRQHGFDHSTAWRAVYKGQRGKRARAILKRIEDDLLQPTGGRLA
jgi:diketogulonate reductase-like aldo/keto reductase